MFPSFHWPVPPNYTIADGGRDVAKSVMLVMVDSSRQMGTLVDFDATAKTLSLQSGSGAPLRIDFASFKVVRFTRGMPLVKAGHQNTAGAMESGKRQKLTLHFVDGEQMQMEVVGVVEHHAGLFLYASSFGQDIMCSFVPACALQKCQFASVGEAAATTAPADAPLPSFVPIKSRQGVETALHSRPAASTLRIGETLLLERLITQAQLDEALKLKQQQPNVPLGEVLVSMGAVKRDTIRRVLVQKLGIPYVELEEFDVDLDLIKSVPSELVRQHNIVPLYRADGKVIAATANPAAGEAQHALGFFTKLKVEIVVASSNDIESAIKKYYGGGTGRQTLQDLVLEIGNNETGAGAAVAAAAAVEESGNADHVLVKLVNTIITDAFEQGASDIHIENMRDNLPTRIRFRKDGVMFDYSEVPPELKSALVSRLKIMCRLDISERRRPQDGKIDFSQFGGQKIELRVLTMPTTDGLEDVVMRILAAPKAVSMETLGLSDYAMAGLKRIAERPHGLLFVCGPTGSGKTTTLHSVLSHINTPDRKIWTVEDPIEITQRGLRQVQVQSKIELTFAAILRSFLRADPDVIMVGETRDPETARTVIEASLTGHLVFSTMHTNSAAESVVRLLDLGLDPFNFADALLGVVGQRLARRLCTACRQPYAASTEDLAMLSHEYCHDSPLDPSEVVAAWRPKYGGAVGKIILYRAKGCPHCNGTGYKGRLGIHELLINTPELKRMILGKANVSELTRSAIGEGMATLRQDGISKILQGLTDWEQIRTI